MAGSSYGSGRRGGFFDAAVAALAAGSVGFATFAMPDHLFGQIVAATGLPQILAAAQPPLGMTARLAAVGAGALLTFALVWALLRALDRAPAAPRPAARAEPDPAAPRVRRADAHPDAPARAPLRAGRDLGEPLDLETLADEAPPQAPEEDSFADLVSQPLPGFLVRQEPEAIAEPEAPLELTDPVGGTDRTSLEALSAALPEADEEAGDTSITDLMRRLEAGLSRRQGAAPAEAAAVEKDEPVADASGAETEADAEPAAEASAPPQAEPARTVADVAAVEPVRAEPPQPQAPPQGRAPPVKVQALSAARAEAAAPPPPADSGDRVGHRLRNAINELQKVSARGA
jgi:hypothetical protein